jgi:hypothetical protein
MVQRPEVSDDGGWNVLLRRVPGRPLPSQTAEAAALVERASTAERRQMRDRLEGAGDWDLIATVANAVAEIEKDPLERGAWRELESFALRCVGAHERAAAVALQVAHADLSASQHTQARRDPRARAWQTVAGHYELLENWTGVVTAINASLGYSNVTVYAQTALHGVKALLASGDAERASRWLERVSLHLEDERDGALRLPLRVQYLSYSSLVLDHSGDSVGAMRAQREAANMAEESTPDLRAVTRMRVARLLLARDASEALRILESIEYEALAPADQTELHLTRAEAATILADLPSAVRACHEAATRLPAERPFWPAALTTWKRVIQTSATTLELLDDPVCEVACRTALSRLAAVREGLNEPSVPSILRRRQQALEVALHDLKQLLEVRTEGIVRTRTFLIDFGQRRLVRLATGARTMLDERAIVLLQRLAMEPAPGWVSSALLKDYLAKAGHKVVDFKKSVVEALRKRHNLGPNELIAGGRGRGSQGYRLEARLGV